MVALTGLIVVAENADSINHKDQPVLVRMRRALQRMRDFPDDDLRKGRLGVRDACLGQQHSLHASQCATGFEVLSMPPTHEMQLDEAYRWASGAANGRSEERAEAIGGRLQAFVGPNAA